MLTTQLERIRNSGIGPQTPPDEIKNIRVFNTLALIVVGSQLASLPLSIYYIHFAGPTVFVCLLMLGLVGLAFILNRYGHHRSARIIAALAAINNIGSYTVLVGAGTNVHFLMPAIMIGAFYYFSYRDKIPLFVITALSLTIFFLLEFWFLDHSPLIQVPSDVIWIVKLYINFTFSIVTFGFMLYGYLIYREAELNLERERARSDTLLLNILPAPIAARLKNQERNIAERFESASILFADIVNFTTLSERLPAEEIVRMLDNLFSEFDTIVRSRGMEKIKTIGDAYMVASGIPFPTTDHRERAADLALEMLTVSSRVFSGDGQQLNLRIGLHCGPVVAGVIGHQKFAYDLWGDSVNTASRMESSGIPGRIQISERFYQELEPLYLIEERGFVEIKGKGSMRTFLLLGRRGS